MTKLLQVKNPHSVLAALQSRPKDVVSVIIGDQVESSSQSASINLKDTWKEVVEVAERLSVPISQGIRPPSVNSRSEKVHFNGKKFGKSLSKEFGRTSVTHAVLKPKMPVSLDQIFKLNPDLFGTWLALDCIQDPQNLGSIFRTAAFFGIRGVILTTERSADLTETVYDVSCGGVEVLPFVQAASLQHVFKLAKEKDIWVLGTSEHAKDSLFQVKKDRNWLLVLGNEEKGLRRLTIENCDLVCSIPQFEISQANHSKTDGKPVVGSLNVAIAAGISFAHFAVQK